VSGIGPKTALSMLGHSEHTNLIASIRQSNVSALCKVPGIGKKTAERLILEIKDKLPQDIGELFLPVNKLSQDAIMALTNLGYSQQHAEKSVKTALKNEDIDDLGLLITEALKHSS
jgi:Holliday junction DNA helicase RuvA